MKKKKCPFCDHTNEDYERFCQFCGRPCQELMLNIPETIGIEEPNMKPLGDIGKL